MNKPGEPVDKTSLVDIPKLISEYFYLKPDPSNPNQRVSFGTSGHRGSAAQKSFNEEHILAITKAVCEYKKAHGFTGAIFIGKDTHALSTPAQMSALRVLSTYDFDIYIHDGYTPTPVISFTILEHNKTAAKKGDGIVITPSHNPPEDGGFKYNPPNGGPAESDVTKEIEQKANSYLGNVTAPSYEKACKKIHTKDFITPYVEALQEIIDIDAIQKASLKLAADPLGGSAIEVYKKINEIYELHLDIKDAYVDPTFSFMPADHDGKIRMDCSSPYAMANLVKLSAHYDLAFGNDTDADRHGIVTPVGGLMNPNHFLSVAIWYLFSHRNWPKHLKIGKTFVSSSMIDKVAASLGVEVYETPVGFKWFAEGLYEGWLGFAGEESAGASFLRKDATAWTTDKDGIIMALLAAEIKAKTKDPALIYKDLEEKFGKSYYARIDVAADAATRAKIKALTPQNLSIDTLAGEKIQKAFSQIHGMDVGGIKIVTQNGWIALRPSGTEDIYKIYAESFLSQEHLQMLQHKAQEIVRSIV